MSEKVVTRFAPSPTGFMHVGNVRTALYGWLWARHTGGQFILRIEDTDKKREVEGSIEHIKETLMWLGLTWDQGPDIGGPHSPYLQSERLEKLDIYKKYADILIDRGFAYADPTEETAIELLRQQAEQEKRPFLFREHRPTNPPAWKPGLALRFKIHDLKRTTWMDIVRGELSAGPEALDDFILIKSDGFPTYNFAHIVDDIEMGVTHVIRGQEFISSTPNYIAVYQALGATEPTYVTVPPILGEGGNKKMGKRDGAKDTLAYQRDGYLPEALVNFLAFLGWNPGGEKELYTREELIGAFDIEKIQKSGAQFNEEKLNWLNREYIKRLEPDDFYKRALLFLPQRLETLPEYSQERVRAMLAIASEHITTLEDLRLEGEAGEYDFYFSKPTITREILLGKDNSDIALVKGYIDELTKLLSSITGTFSKDTVKEAVWQYASEIGRAKVLWPMRVALSGKQKSPDPFALAEVFGKEETIARLKYALSIK